MGRGIPLGGGFQLQEPDPTAALIVQALGPLLKGISNQLDLMIQLQVGAADPEEWKQKILEAHREQDARDSASGNGRGT